MFRVPSAFTLCKAGIDMRRYFHSIVGNKFSNSQSSSAREADNYFLVTSGWGLRLVEAHWAPCGLLVLEEGPQLVNKMLTAVNNAYNKCFMFISKKI